MKAIAKRVVLYSTCSLLAFTILFKPRAALAGPPKLVISNTAVIVASSILLAAITTTAIVTKGMWKEEQEEELRKKKEREKKEYKPRSKDQMKLELEEMRKGDWNPGQSDSYTPEETYPYDTDSKDKD